MREFFREKAFRPASRALISKCRIIVTEYNPPPNPAKLSDSRAPGYIAKHGASSWEVDALPPQILSSIIRTALDEVTDEDEIDRIKEREAEDKKRLREMVEGI